MTKKNIRTWLDKMGVKNYYINKDLSVDVPGNVSLYGKKINQLPFQFGVIKGDFDCSNNQLTSLMNSPRQVDGDFSCTNNLLTSLEGCTQTIGGNFYCHYNKLVSLVGGPLNVGGNYFFRNNELTSLKGCPEIIHGDFECSCNLLTNFEFCPKIIKKSFSSYWNQIENLDFFPDSVGNFDFNQTFKLDILSGLYNQDKIDVLGNVVLKRLNAIALQEVLHEQLFKKTNKPQVKI